MVAKRVAQQRAKYLQDALEKKFGSNLPEEPRSVLSQLLFNLIARNWTRQGAQKAFERFQREFVDWNEVRISPVSEIASILERDGAPNAEKKAKNIKKVLIDIYNDYHKVTLDFLRDKGTKEIKEVLEGQRGTSERVVDSVLLFALDYPVVPLHSPIPRVLKRVGIVDHADSPEELKATVQEIVPKKDLAKFCQLVIFHGEQTCTLKDPNCKGCVLRAWCPEPERRVKLAANAKARAKHEEKVRAEASKKQAKAEAAQAKRAAQKALDDAKHAKPKAQPNAGKSAKSPAKPVKAQPPASKAKANANAKVKGKR